MKVKNCRLCKGLLSDPVIKFPPTPLANEFLTTKQPQDLFPLEVCECEHCGHYQLNETVDPERLFKHYVFVAGTSSVNVEHFKKYAENMISKFKLKPKSKVLDIASNDGTLLKHFKDIDMNILGIDPAENIAKIANENNIPTIPDFFTETKADDILKDYGKFDLITANNVFAHVPDIIGFAKGVKKLLSNKGVFSFEVSYFYDVCNNTLFDTIYHEHTSFHTIKPLCSFFKKHGLELFDCDMIPTHGGSIRVFVRHDKFYNKILSLIRFDKIDYLCYLEDKNMRHSVYKLKKDIKLLGLELREKLREIKDEGKTVCIYGTPAKATTLMYGLNIDENQIQYAIDDNPLKQGTFTPGKHIPVYNSKALKDLPTDYVLILAWNFAQSIIANNPDFKGKWIVPVPQLKVI
jgi:SAM-dependent methyltransferase